VKKNLIFLVIASFLLLGKDASAVKVLCGKQVKFSAADRLKIETLEKNFDNLSQTNSNGKVYTSEQASKVHDAMTAAFDKFNEDVSSIYTAVCEKTKTSSIAKHGSDLLMFSPEGDDAAICGPKQFYALDDTSNSKLTPLVELYTVLRSKPYLDSITNYDPSTDSKNLHKVINKLGKLGNRMTRIANKACHNINQDFDSAVLWTDDGAEKWEKKLETW